MDDIEIEENLGYTDVLTPIEEKLIRDAFEIFDTDGSGTVTLIELQEIMKNLFGEDLNDQEVIEMIGEADLDGDGEICLDEFLKKMSELIVKSSEVNKNGIYDETKDNESNRRWSKLGELISAASLYQETQTPIQTKHRLFKFLQKHHDRQLHQRVSEGREILKECYFIVVIIVFVGFHLLLNNK